MKLSCNSKAILYKVCCKSLLHTVVNTTIYRLTSTESVFPVQQREDELGICLYGLYGVCDAPKVGDLQSLRVNSCPISPFTLFCFPAVAVHLLSTPMASW